MVGTAALVALGACGGAAQTERPAPGEAEPAEPEIPKAEGMPPQAYQLPSEQPGPGPAPPVDPRLLAVVSQHPSIRGFMPVPLLELDAPDRSLVVLWPLFSPTGELTDSDRLVAFVVARAPAPAVIAGPYDATELTPDVAAGHLGTDAFEVRERGGGLGLLSVGAELETRPDRFVEAIESGDRNAAVDHAVWLSRAYGPWSIRDRVSRTLLGAARRGLRVEHLSTTTPRGDAAIVRLVLSEPDRLPVEVAVPVRQVGVRRWWIAE